MDLGAPEAFLGVHSFLFGISGVLTIACQKDIINVRGWNSFEVKTAGILISISGGEKQYKRKVVELIQGKKCRYLHFEFCG